MLSADSTDENATQKIAEMATAWQQMEALPHRLEAPLKARFQAALSASGQDQHSYRALLQNNTAHFDASLLHLEILSGVASPAELARERLQMQVEVLQNSLKRGAAENLASALLQRLLTLPSLPDASRTERLEKLLSVSESL